MSTPPDQKPAAQKPAAQKPASQKQSSPSVGVHLIFGVVAICLGAAMLGAMAVAFFSLTTERVVVVNNAPAAAAPAQAAPAPAASTTPVQTAPLERIEAHRTERVDEADRRSARRTERDDQQEAFELLKGPTTSNTKLPGEGEPVENPLAAALSKFGKEEPPATPTATLGELIADDERQLTAGPTGNATYAFKSNEAPTGSATVVRCRVRLESPGGVTNGVVEWSAGDGQFTELAQWTAADINSSEEATWLQFETPGQFPASADELKIRFRHTDGQPLKIDAVEWRTKQ
ncbi:MAG: hypothetical protein QGG36_32350 [Pirellulaceae bacterium]|nr:hypothetical protein [Pirellulaceae bacterium]